MDTRLSALQDTWQPDAAQAHALGRLDALRAALTAEEHGKNRPQGLWLFGPPGRGKSRLLEVFMAQGMGAQRRVHFHAFVEEIYARLHALPIGGDPLEKLASELAVEAPVLGFDEFYLTNIADAMLLGRLMKLLFARGVVVVATSNWAMDELFQGGLNRDRFMPFLRLMKAHLEPLDLSDGPDWRLLKVVAQRGAYVRIGEEAQLETLFTTAAAQTGEALADWPVGEGVVRQQGNAVALTFKQACGTPHSRHEYSRLVQRYETLMVTGIPQLGPNDADATIRLVTLVDILYENQRQLLVSAAVPPTELCRVPPGKPSWPAAELFQRTASRLVEMTGGGAAA